MKLGYARVSSRGQNLDRQLDALKKSGVKSKNIYKEKISGATIKKRPAIQRLIFNVKRGDIIYVLALDRLGRNADDIKKILDAFKKKGATVDILNLPSFKDVKNANLRALLDDLIIDIYSYQAEAERQAIRKRQAQGIIEAKKEHKYHGRKTEFYLDSPKVQIALKQYFNKSKYKLSTIQIARLHNISISEFYKLIKKYRQRTGIL